MQGPDLPDAKLDRISRIITVVSSYVNYSKAIPFSSKDWYLPPQKQKTRRIFPRLRTKMNRLYLRMPGARIGQDKPLDLGGYHVSSFRHPIYRMLPPLIFLPLLLFIALIEWVYPGSYIIVAARWPSADPTVRVISITIAVIGVALVLAVAYFAYKMFLGRLVGRGLPRELKFVMVITAVFVIIAWWWSDHLRIWDSFPFSTIDLGTPYLDATEANLKLEQIWYSATYFWLFSFPLIYLPGLLLYSLLFAFPVALIMAVPIWGLNLHRTQSSQEIRQFLEEPLPLGDPDGMTKLIELEPEEIEVLHEWSSSRQEIVQNKLIPTTLFLAVVAILVGIPERADWANVVNVFADFAGWVYVEVVSHGIPAYLVSAFFFSYGFLIVLGIVVLPILFIAALLNESFVADYIKQACVLAKHIKPIGAEPKSR